MAHVLFEWHNRVTQEAKKEGQYERETSMRVCGRHVPARRHSIQSCARLGPADQPYARHPGGHFLPRREYRVHHRRQRRGPYKQRTGESPGPDCMRALTALWMSTRSIRIFSISRSLRGARS